MGCFLELLSLAAGETGHRTEMDLFPQGDEASVAVVRFLEGGMPDPLFAQMLNRHSCKEPFEETAVPDDLAHIERDPDMVEQIKAITWEAWMMEASALRAMKESVDLFRMGKGEINANPDGIDLGGPFLETLMLFGMLTREGWLDPTSSEFAQGVALYGCHAPCNARLCVDHDREQHAA